jgi:formamidopyrimidine-DNA glycosylase
MPELPEVETVRRGLSPLLTRARITGVDMRRPDLRFPFPDRLGERLQGALIRSVDRRAKYLLLPLDTGETLMAHLGMTGRFRVVGGERAIEPGAFYAPDPPAGHDHLVIDFETEGGSARRLIYSDPRRFGCVTLLDREGRGEGIGLPAMGPEPLGQGFDGPVLRRALAGKATSLKAALLDQRTVAGLGNIYVCEALFRAGLSPRRTARTVGPGRAARLAEAIRTVLEEAIAAGGSTLRDYVDAEGRKGSFQQRFDVYDREGEACRRCGGTVVRYVQSGRSTFACGGCQR